MISELSVNDFIDKLQELVHSGKGHLPVVTIGNYETPSIWEEELDGDEEGSYVRYVVIGTML